MEKIFFEMGENTQAVYNATNKLVDNLIAFVKELLSGENKGKMICLHEPQDVAAKDPIKWLNVDENGEVRYTTTEWLSYNLSDGLTANEATELANDFVSSHYNIVDYEEH